MKAPPLPRRRHNNSPLTCAQLAEMAGGVINHSDSATAQYHIYDVGSLANADKTQVAFCVDAKYRHALHNTRAGVVLTTADLAADVPTIAIIVATPRLAFNQLCRYFRPPPPVVDNRACASIAADATIAPSARIAAGVVIHSGVTIAAGAHIDAGAIIGCDTVIGEATVVGANAVIHYGVTIGAYSVIGAGSIIGGDGFGFSPTDSGWVADPQVGGVRIGNNVSIGCGTTIDRGAIDDTVIEDGVIIDNQVHAGHNVHIGRQTAIAGAVTIGGSVVIGARCKVAGASAIADHVTIADDVTIQAMTLVSKSIKTPGEVWAGAPRMQRYRQWQQNAVLASQLAKMRDTITAMQSERGKQRDE